VAEGSCSEAERYEAGVAPAHKMKILAWGVWGKAYMKKLI
jgi:hypothetical protein